jgi:hypothetical protein
VIPATRITPLRPGRRTGQQRAFGPPARRQSRDLLLALRSPGRAGRAGPSGRTATALRVVPSSGSTPSGRTARHRSPGRPGVTMVTPGWPASNRRAPLDAILDDGTAWQRPEETRTVSPVHCVACLCCSANSRRLPAAAFARYLEASAAVTSPRQSPRSARHARWPARTALAPKAARPRIPRSSALPADYRRSGDGTGPAPSAHHPTVGPQQPARR